MKKSITIAIPSRDNWKAKFGLSFAKLLAYSLLESPHDIQVSNERGSTVTINRNKLVDLALKNKSEYVLFLDDDMTFPPEALLQLLKHNKDIVGVNAAKKIDEVTPTGRNLQGRMLVPSSGLESVRYLGGACLLIKTEVFQKIGFPYFLEDVVNQTGEDVYFCEKAREHGYEIFCDHDLSKNIGHVGDKEYKLL